MSFPEKKPVRKKPEEQSIPRTPPITWQEWQKQIVEQIGHGFTANEVLNWTKEEYAERRAAMERAMKQQLYLPDNPQHYGLPQVNHYSHSHGLPQQQSLSLEALEKYRRAIEDEQASKRSFISPDVEQRIMEWTRQDARVHQFWYLVNRRVRRGLNDEIVDGMMAALSTVMREVDVERDRLNTRNVDNIRSLGNAIYEVIAAFDDAVSRGDLEYMRPLVEELEEAMHAITGKETHDPEE